MVMMMKKPRKKKMGRPPLYPGQETHRVVVSVDDATHAEWKRAAQARGISMAQLMREALETMKR